jgi:hypothetical protein
MNSYKFRETFKDYDFETPLFKHLKEVIMSNNNFNDDTKVDKMSFFFDEMIWVEQRYGFHKEG